MNLKIHGGTVCHSEDTLCATCIYSTIIRGRRLDEEIIKCNGRGIRGALLITFRVTSCSDYTDARLPSMMQLMENAWVLRRGRKSRPAGFVHGRDLRVEELDELIMEASGDDGAA